MDRLMELVTQLGKEKKYANLCIAICLLFGAVKLLHITHDVVRLIWSMFFRQGKDVKKKFGKTAVITGATDGIGKAVAFEFARKGCNVALLSRTQSKLDECAAEIKAKYPNVDVSVHAVDFSNFNQKARDQVAAFLKDVEVGVLYNNVGVSYPYPQYFNELTDDRVADLMGLNIDATVWMTRIVLPGMIDRKKGAIVNMSSSAGVVTSPLLSGYSGAKGYLKHFSESLNVELKGKGVHVQCQVPLFVATKLAKIRKASLFVPSPEGFARSAVACIGYDTVISPYWAHMLQLFVIDCLPKFIVNKVVFNMHADLRKRGMKKEGKNA